MERNVKLGNGTRGGVGFCSLLGLAFIILKLCGVIHWSWVWVLAPFWISLGVVILLLIIVAVAAALSKD